MFFPARTLSTSPNQLSAKPQSQAETVTVTIATRDGKFPVKCKIGDTLYDAVAAADVIEGYGACDGKPNKLMFFNVKIKISRRNQ